ncbi:hypothetical protein HUK65_18065 [Rhodobacteraceae bacterium 2376]|uniref:KAP NTPase domain-containing protein n=1 Tax=Rhabdonatronobacter sediminivivens TaxID=2743469 RepID=A0A7Z0I2P8_9RHOB|nr:P-loop NTPase fold protein [Rhabdonatronobacter sediminivivens]NYS26865.1 hypothetical protein [Rhabdonatronobacter sediminivivens]
MRFLPPEPEVTLYKTAFDNDILGREKAGSSLSALLDRIEDPLVIALDGRWGTGKTYFLKRWVGAHREQNKGRALTLYFDAFANDYLSDPLVALVSALADRVPAQDEPKLTRLKSTASKFVKPLAKIALNIATFGAKEALNDLGDAAAEAIHAEAERVVDDFWDRAEGRQQAMQSFRDALSELVDGKGDAEPTPLIIVIDELDRCRPDYALEVLEVIKHFFAVPMVHFVLGVNLSALENSVRARYGNDIDAAAYLQKFISLTFTLPDRAGGRHQDIPAVLAYAKHTAAAMKLPKEYVSEIVERQLPGVMRRNLISIRDIGKILAAVSILPPEALNPRLFPGWRAITASMIIARIIRSDIFKKMVVADLTDEELVTYLDATPEKINRKLPDDEHNQDYDHPTWYMYRSWQVILSDGKAEFEDVREIKNQFSQFGDFIQAKDCPRRIFDDYLNTFETV